MSQHPLNEMRSYFETGATLSYNFRKQKLKQLEQALLMHEEEIYEALYADLKKSKEEAYATELGLLLGELRLALRNLKKWMRPQSARTDLVNFPSSTKIYQDPLGVVLIIAPWNYPLQLQLIPLVGAIAAGNCVVLKPSELAPATAAIIEKIISPLFPPEYVQVVQGDGASVIPSMMGSFRFDHVFYTGSIPVGKIIYQLAAKDLVPVTLELGGKSPVIVEAGADLTVAARRIVLGKYLNAGQTCIAPDYLLVDKTAKSELIEKIKTCIDSFYGKNKMQSGDYGKIINEKRFDKLLGYFQDGKLVYGGEHDRSKLFMSPTIMENVSLDSALMKEEIFGPILPMLEFSSFEEALSIVKQNPNPLAFYLFSANPQQQQAWVKAVHFGGGCINNTAYHFANYHIGFGGIGNSGIGSYHGKHSFDTFSHAKPLMKTPVWFDPSFKYPPYKGKIRLFKWFIK
ncbi:MAG: aldehyde dehydrogenase family protein [Bacteroidetes bacterium]|nr:aldehyde dehydrogenase family protein [Bacteroidota bacterium]